MKKILVIALLTIFTTITPSPWCWDYQGYRWLRQEPFGPVKCDCACERQYTTPADGNYKKGAKCLQCGHKLIRKTQENMNISYANN